MREPLVPVHRGNEWPRDRQRRVAGETLAVPHPAVVARLERLTPDQRAAATAPPGPILCVAPAGSGKTTTLVARIAWLVDEGADPRTVAAITFNKRAAEELGERLDVALAPLDVEAGVVRVRTFHALGREILREAGVDVRDLVDRATVLAEVVPGLRSEEVGRYDTAFSRLKLELRVDPRDIAADVAAGPVAQAFVRYEAVLAARGALDFDDLVRRALDRLEADAALLARWRAALRPSPRRRGPGRRPESACAGPAAGRPGEPGLPRR